MSNFSKTQLYDIIETKTRDCRDIILSAGIGLTWSFCHIINNQLDSIGFAQTCNQQVRTLPWPGTLKGKNVNEMAKWVKSWNFHEATLGLAACNAIINKNTNQLMANAPLIIGRNVSHNLAVFQHFKSEIINKKVVVIGRYPGIDTVLEGVDYTVLERDPTTNDLPDTACEFVIPEADWVFITATSIINKTFPRLAALATNATSVLMGPSMPWLEEFRSMGINYLAGVKIRNVTLAEQIAIEGGGTRLFDDGVQYAVQKLD